MGANSCVLDGFHPQGEQNRGSTSPLGANPCVLAGFHPQGERNQHGSNALVQFGLAGPRRQRNRGSLILRPTRLHVWARIVAYWTDSIPKVNRTEARLHLWRQILACWPDFIPKVNGIPLTRLNSSRGDQHEPAVDRRDSPGSTKDPVTVSRTAGVGVAFDRGDRAPCPVDRLDKSCMPFAIATNNEKD